MSGHLAAPLPATKSANELRVLNNALFEAIEAANRSKVITLLEQGAQLDARGIYNRTPLMVASERGNTEIVEIILHKAGADAERLLTQTSSGGLDCLHHACMGWAVDGGVVALLMEKGARPTSTNDKLECLYWCTHFANVKAVQLLLDVDPSEVDLEAKDLCGWTLFMNAMQRFSIPYQSGDAAEVLLLLVDRGVRLDGDLPEDLFFKSVDETLVGALGASVIEPLFLYNYELPTSRRAIRWALSSPAVQAFLKEPFAWEEWRGKPLVREVSTAEEAKEVIKMKLTPLRDDAWARRRHLCLAHGQPRTALKKQKK
jgi:ankyrin repeat protein